MINFEKHLKEVLYEYDFIVIPNFGAFIANFEVIDNNGESFPIKTFSFNHLLNIDENKKFFNYLVRVENKPVSEIEIQWNNYLLNLKNELNKNKRYEVSALGSVIINSEREITFKFLDGINFYERDAFANEDNFISPTLVNIQEDIDENSHSENNIIEDIPVILPESAKEISTLEVTPTLIEQSTINEDYEANENYYEVEPTNKWKFLIWLLPLLLVSIAAYYFWNQQKEEKVPIPVIDSTAIAKDSTIILDSSSFDTTSIIKQEAPKPEEIDTASKVISKPIANEPKVRYHVWAGLFRSKSNANKLRGKLRRGGLKAEIQIVKDMRRVYVPVSTESQAKTTVKKIEQLTGEKAVYFEVD